MTRNLYIGKGKKDVLIVKEIISQEITEWDAGRLG
jgi:hypothetical protein